MLTNEQMKNIKFQAEPANYAIPAGFSKGATSYKITLRHNGRRMTFPFFQGSGIRHMPALADVMECISGDAAAGEEYSDVWDFAGEFGYEIHDKASYKQAERTFNACRRTARKLRSFLGDELYEAALYQNAEQ